MYNTGLCFYGPNAQKEYRAVARGPAGPVLARLYSFQSSVYDARAYKLGGCACTWARTLVGGARAGLKPLQNAP